MAARLAAQAGRSTQTHWLRRDLIIGVGIAVLLNLPIIPV
jgi:hypothetical protein